MIEELKRSSFSSGGPNRAKLEIKVYNARTPAWNLRAASLGDTPDIYLGDGKGYRKSLF